MDIYIKQAVLHQFTPDDTELVLSDQLLAITPKIEEYLRKKIERVYSDDAKTGILGDDHTFLEKAKSDLLEASLSIAQLWKEEFVLSENQKTNDLLFVAYEKNGIEHFAFLRIALRESLVHLAENPENPLILTQNNLPSAGSAPDEAILINLQSG